MAAIPRPGQETRRRSRIDSWGKEPDPTDVELRTEREIASVPWSKSPFPKAPTTGPLFPQLRSTADYKPLEEDTDENELKVVPSEEVEWIDLLLELAMTTAFANLADNTPLLTGKEASSYVAFFALVWWIWASQVAYNMRFRQADWFHRTVAFLQLVVLCGMAAFTSDFDITVGLYKPNEAAERVQNTIQKEVLGISENQLAATEFRLERLPVINARGIAAVMGASRLLMLLQYGVVLWYARNIRRRSAILVHAGSLVLSALLFLISFLILGTTTRVTSILKLILWYSALVVEVGTHYYANTLSGHVGYRSEAVYGRSSTLFVVVLGIGLDKITNQFQFVVGTVGFDAGTVFITLSIAIILIGLFALYFSTGSTMNVGNQRRLAYFFTHFPFMAAVIVMLRGVAILLGFTNLYKAAESMVEMVSFLPSPEQNKPELCDVANATKVLDAANREFWKSGLSFPDWIGKWSEEVCLPIARANNLTEVLGVETKFIQLLMEPIAFLFEQFEASPAPESDLGIAIQQFQTSNDPNITNSATFFNIFGDMLISRLTPALWFMGTGGLAIIMIGVLTLIRQLPRDKWEWGSVITRLLGGTGYAMLSFLNLRAGRPLFLAFKDPVTEELITQESPALIWKFAGSGWILPSYALTLAGLNLVNAILSWFARRSYRKHDKHSSLTYYSEDPKEIITPPRMTQTPMSGSFAGKYDDPYFSTPPTPAPGSVGGLPQHGFGTMAPHRQTSTGSDTTIAPMSYPPPSPAYPPAPPPHRQSSGGLAAMTVTPAPGASTPAYDNNRMSSSLHYAYSS